MPDGGGRLPADLSEAVPPEFRVVARRSALVLDRIEVVVPVGTTVAQAVELAFGGKMDPTLYSHGHAQLGEYVMPSALWGAIKPKQGTTVNVMLVPQGNTGRMLLGIAIVVAAAFAAPYLAGALLGVSAAAAAAAGGATLATFTATTALVTAGIAFAGNLLLNALIPLRPPTLQTRQASQTYSISGGRNSASPWGAVPVILGRHRYAPLYAARSYTEASGNDQWLRQLFVFGYGPLRIEDIRIGNTLIGDFDDVQMEVREGLPGDAPITLYPGQVLEQAFSHDMPDGGDWVVERSDPDADELSIDWTYPKGLVKFNSKGKPQETSSVIEVEYREVGALDWIHFGTFDIEEKKQDPFRIGKVWSVAKGQYDVRLRCIDDNSETQSQVWTALRTIRHEVPFTFAKPLALLALRIRAQGQLNGVIDNLTAICTSRCKAWNGAAWVDNVETSNPADLYRYVLQHPANALPRADGQIDLPTIQGWRNDCSGKGLEFNMVRDNAASVLETLTDIATAGRANPSRPNGKWSVIQDKQKTVAADHFTDRNAWDFQVERNYRDIPDAWRARFVDRQYDWKQDERIIYREGVTPLTAQNFETIEFKGVTDAGKVWTEGQRRFRELAARADVYSFSTTWEHLRVNRGDLVLVQSNVTRWGLAAGRVKSVAGEVIDLDDFVEMDVLQSYAIRFRRPDGSTLVRDVVSEQGRTNTITLAGSGAHPSIGDLFMFGDVNFETHRLIITDITEGEDQGAKVTAVDEAMPFIEEADEIDVPVWVPRTPSPDATVPAVPVIVGVSSGNSQQVVGDDGTVYSPVTVGVAAGQGGPVPTASFQIQHRYQGSTQWRTETLAAGATSVSLTGYVFEDAIEIRARALSRDSTPSAFTSPPVPHVVQQRTVPPPNVIDLTYRQLSSRTRHYEWVLDDPEGDGPPPDLLGYQIRYKAGTGHAWGALDRLHTGTLSSSPYETTTPQVAGVYTFGIVATNYSGNISATPLLVVFDLPGGVAPNQPHITTPSQVTSDNTPTITGTADNGTTVHVYANGIDKGTGAVALGVWSITTSALADAVYDVTAIAYDSAGQGSDPSAPISVTVDTISPAAPVISTSSPLVTTDTTPSIAGTGETGATLQVYRAGSTPAAAPVTVAGGAWARDLNALAIGAYTITAEQTDAAGHTSPPSLPLTLNIIPVAPAISTASATIGNTNPVVAGTSTPGASVGVYVDAVLNQTVTANGSGAWTATLAGLAGGARSITARQTVSGQLSDPSTAITLTVVWYDPDASIHADFKGGNYRLNGVASTLAGIFDVITTSPQITTNADGSLHAVAANAAPTCDRGLELWENRTNRNTNRNAAPVDLTGVTLSGDPAATLTRVDDSAAMAGSILAALLAGGTLNGFVYKLDNTSGAADAFATIGGTVAVVGACRGSIVYRGSAGRIEIGGATAVSFAASTPYVRAGGSRTAAATTEQMRIAAPAGAVVYFVLNQLENGGFDTAPIVVNAAATARNSPVIQHTAGADFNNVEGFFGARAKVAAGATNSGIVVGSIQPTISDGNLIQYTTTTAMRGLTQVGASATGVASQALTATSLSTGVYGYKAGDFGFAANGLATVVDTAGAVPTGTPVKITVSLGVTPPLNGIVEQVKWGTAKPSSSVIQAKSGWTTLT